MSWICFSPFYLAAYVVAEKQKATKWKYSPKNHGTYEATPADRIVATDPGHLIDLTYVSLDCCWSCDTFPSILM